MPYKIEKRGSQYCVIRRDTGENKGCSNTKQEAQAHMNAMLANEHQKSKEANVGDAKNIQLKAWDGRFVSQEEAQYTTLSNTPGQACANCRWFSAAYDACMIVEDYPQPILATGHSNRWEATPSDVQTETEQEPVPVVIVEPTIELEDSSEMMSLSVPKSFGQRVKDFIASLRAKPAPVLQRIEGQTGFKTFTTADGKMAWVARYTGKFIDREDEILADQAHEDYVRRVQAGNVPLPELWMWHANGTRHGEAKYVWKSGGFVCAAGLIDDTPAGRKAFDYYQQHNGEIKLSHMFYFPPEAKINGVYTKYTFTKEITTLPDGAEAFPYTSFKEINTMTIPQAGQDMIRDALGQETLDAALALDGKAATDTKMLEANGVAFKAKDEPVPAPAVQPAEDKAADELVQLKASVALLTAAVKRNEDQLQLEIQAKTDLLKQLNAVKGQLALLTDLKPPASQSTETLLNNREKSIVESAMEQAKAADGGQSYIEKLLGVQPTIQS